MRFLLILLVALSLTIAWQSSVIAADTADKSQVAEAEKTGDKSAKKESKEKDKKKAGGEEEPEPDCD